MGRNRPGAKHSPALQIEEDAALLEICFIVKGSEGRYAVVTGDIAGVLRYPRR
jgi:hypothetical protein